MRKVFSLLCLTAVLHLSVSGEKLEPVKYRKLSCGLRYFLWPSCSDPSSLQQKVCGSDNKTYASFCAFKVARCYAKKDYNTKLTLQYKGECGEPESPIMTLTKDSRRNGPFGCPILRKCDDFKGDLSCGSDGRIYMNDCHLNYTKCRGKKFLKPMPLGFCQNSRKFLPVTSCPRHCPTSSRPVCGTNRKTYESICHLDRVICALRKENNASLALYYFGACNSPATQEPCPKLEECKSAPKKPVCGSNGKTYSSLCHLRAAMCLGKRPKDHRACHAACTLPNNPKKSPGKSPQELKACIDTCALQNADENLNLHYFGECNAPINLKPCPSRQECRIHGPRKPVCGSNRRTYRNLCIFRASSCRKTKPLKILYEEIC